MPLLKINEFDPQYNESFQGNDIKGMDVYTQTNNEKLGTVNDIIVDDQGHFRYLVIDISGWIAGKKVLLPVGRSQIDNKAGRIYAVGLSKEQAQNLPEFNERMGVDDNHEERVRGVYGTQASVGAAQQDSSLYEMNDRDHQTLKLYEERLVANKKRVKTGEVAVGKRVETENKQVSVQIEKERLVIERVTPADAGKAVAPGTVDFREGEVAHVEIYEETADIHKEAFVREEVRVKKVVDQETVQAQETIRREELDVNTEGTPVVEGSDRLPKNRI